MLTTKLCTVAGKKGKENVTIHSALVNGILNGQNMNINKLSPSINNKKAFFMNTYSIKEHSHKRKFIAFTVLVKQLLFFETSLKDCKILN